MGFQPYPTIYELHGLIFLVLSHLKIWKEMQLAYEVLSSLHIAGLDLIMFC